MTHLYQRYDVDEETPVQFVGVHPVRWLPSWGPPSAMFAEVDDPVYDAAPELLEACKAALYRLESYNYSAMERTIEKLKAAIAKAEGRVQR